jgi:phosphate/sulfate permease
VAFYWAKYALFHGVNVDVVNAQKEHNILSGDVEAMHARAEHYDNEAEYMYSFLQVMTAATASFTHGANDVSKYAALAVDIVTSQTNGWMLVLSARTRQSTSSGTPPRLAARFPFLIGSCKYTLTALLFFVSIMLIHATVLSVVAPSSSGSGPTATTS